MQNSLNNIACVLSTQLKQFITNKKTFKSYLAKQAIANMSDAVLNAVANNMLEDALADISAASTMLTVLQTAEDDTLDAIVLAAKSPNVKDYITVHYNEAYTA